MNAYARAHEHPKSMVDANQYLALGAPVLFVGFHPDDLDFHASGLTAILTAAGVEVIYVVATSGDAAGLRSVRELEQRQSAAEVGVTHVEFLRFKDGSLRKEFSSGRLEARLASTMRKFRPSAVVTFCPANLTTLSWGAEHPDHRYGAMAVWDAVYPGSHRDKKRGWLTFWRPFEQGHHVKEVLWFGDDLPSPYNANCYVPVDSVWDSVSRAQRQHVSQWGDAQPTIAKSTQRACRAAERWQHPGLAEEYHRVLLSE